MVPINKSPLSEYEQYMKDKGARSPEPFMSTKHIIEVVSKPEIEQKMLADENFRDFMEKKIWYVKKEPGRAELRNLIDHYYRPETSFIYNILVDMYISFLSVSNLLSTQEIESFRNAMTSHTPTGKRIATILQKRRDAVKFISEHKIAA